MKYILLILLFAFSFSCDSDDEKNKNTKKLDKPNYTEAKDAKYKGKEVFKGFKMGASHAVTMAHIDSLVKTEDLKPTATGWSFNQKIGTDTFFMILRLPFKEEMEYSGLSSLDFYLYDDKGLPRSDVSNKFFTDFINDHGFNTPKLPLNPIPNSVGVDIQKNNKEFYELKTGYDALNTKQDRSHGASVDMFYISYTFKKKR